MMKGFKDTTRTQHGEFTFPGDEVVHVQAYARGGAVRKAKVASPKVAVPKGLPKPDPAAKSDSSVRSPTSTRTEVRSPTKTSTVADTKGNVTVTGGAGDGDTVVYIGVKPAVSEARRTPMKKARGGRVGTSNHDTPMIKAK